jgi:hypothetical protein
MQCIFLFQSSWIRDEAIGKMASQVVDAKPRTQNNSPSPHAGNRTTPKEVRRPHASKLSAKENNSSSSLNVFHGRNKVEELLVGLSHATHDFCNPERGLVKNDDNIELKWDAQDLCVPEYELLYNNETCTGTLGKSYTQLINLNG